MPLHRTLTWCTAALLTGGFAALALAQDRNERFDGIGSLAALTAEVRQLRLVIEELAKGQTALAKDQTQTQALAVYLSVQQSRILQVTARLDATRDELAEAETDLQKREAASREAELFQMLQVEEARWVDLIARLERVIKQ